VERTCPFNDSPRRLLERVQVKECVEGEGPLRGKNQSRKVDCLYGRIFETVNNDMEAAKSASLEDDRA